MNVPQRAALAQPDIQLQTPDSLKAGNEETFVSSMLSNNIFNMRGLYT